MTEPLIIKVLLGAFVASVAGINIKIIWDWLSRPKENRTDITKLTYNIRNIIPDIEKLTEKIDNLAKTSERLSSVVMGNGRVEESIVFRIATIEKFMKEMQKIKESRGL